MDDFHPSDIVTFWHDAGPARWFVKDAAFDARFRERFKDAHFAAARRELDDWMGHAESALALVLLLDQFPRNCFRDCAHSYATDGLAKHVASQSIDRGFDREVDPALRVFFYLPFEHSEDIADQQRSVTLCEPLGDTQISRYAEMHRELIARFGRFPHRNAALGRITTADEQAYLDSGGFHG